MNSQELARRVRIDAVRMVHEHHASHIASALSVVDILTVLYHDIMHINPQNPNMPERDRLVLSKGHAGVAIYATLAEMGFFELERLDQYYSDGSVFSGHVSHKGVPGVELSTGSLGHGVCVAVGMAFAAKRSCKKHRVYAIVGDGECDEGAVWETALFAQQYRLGNLTVIVDHNKMQAMGTCEAVMNLGDLAEKWKAFGWHVISVENGNNHDQLRKALQSTDDELPTCIIANTVKGKGVSFMENNLLWHYRDPQGDAYIKAMQELGAEDIYA
ncbi:transketolase [Agathobaculum desmolans]|uniref:transketolase n=1 Tax=Agathobaculum desmolans TaxID=39484 RepID=UPI0004E241CF|nr:transketolase [Agathobaculum desmolans]